MNIKNNCHQDVKLLSILLSNTVILGAILCIKHLKKFGPLVQKTGGHSADALERE